MKKQDKVEIAVLVNSCDAYSDLWEYYFYFVNRYWSNCPYRYYINTEKLQCEYYTNVGKVITLNYNKKCSWSERLYSALDRIEENYVIMMCEDSFFYDDARQDILDECEKMVEEDSSIGCISFDQHLPDTFGLGKVGEQFRTRDIKENYLATAYCSLWKKSYLMKILRKRESAWDFELYGTIRARHYKGKQFALVPNAPLVFPFEIKGNSGCGVSSGKWTKGNIELFKKHNLHCDFEKRGFMDWNEVYKEWAKPQKKLTFFEKIFMPFKDNKKFREKLKPKIKTFTSKVDIKGRIRNIFD